MTIRTIYIYSILTVAVWAAAPDGSALYATKCAVCHDATAAGAGEIRVPKKEELAKRTPQNVLDAMTTGVMREQSKSLSDEEKRAVATFLTGKVFDSTAATVTPQQGLCTGTPPPIQLGKNDWNGWGFDPENTRYQPNPGLKAEDVPKLKLKWAFGFKNAVLGYSQPTVVSGRYLRRIRGWKLVCAERQHGLRVVELQDGSLDPLGSDPRKVRRPLGCICRR